MPHPLSETVMLLIPPSSIQTLTFEAPLSIALSSISLRAEAGRSTTSPAAILEATTGSRISIAIFIPPYPAL